MTDLTITYSAALYDLQAQQSLAAVNAIAIASEADYSLATGTAKAIKLAYKELEAARVAITKPLDEQKSAVMAAYKKPAAVLEQCESIVKSKLLAWTQEQERKRQAAERASQEAARVEREALQLENQRLQAAAESLRISAQEQAAAGNHQAALDAMALAAQSSAAADNALATVDEIAAAPVAMAVKHQGVSTVTRWSAEVLDLRTLAQAVADGKAPLQCLSANMVFLNQQAVSYKADLKIAGVQAVPTTSVAVRT